MSGRLVLIASYPKSGNTWVRLFFENLLRGDQGPVSINDIQLGFYGQARRLYFDQLAAAPASDLLPEEIENLLPELYARLAREARGPVFIKVHDRARLTPDGRPLFPPEHVGAVLYLARHPYDVAVSYAHHRGIPLAEAAADLCDENHTIAAVGRGTPLALPERPGSWATHLASWTQGSPYPVTLARYEDLRERPLEAFARLAAAAGVAASDEAIAQAVRATDFAELKAQESDQGFRERPRSSPAFFNQGKAQSWVGVLDPSLQRIIVQCCRSFMRQLGYPAD